jgi:carboxyl-terminal processing protease
MRSQPSSKPGARSLKPEATRLGSRPSLPGARAVAGITLVMAGCGGPSETQFDCSVAGRKAFVASIMRDYYLWHDRVPEVDYAAIATPEELMRELSFRELDHWSGMQLRAERSDFFDRGRFQGFGYALGNDGGGGLRVSWVHEGSAAGRAGLDRGALLLAVNGLTVAELSQQELGVELAKDVVVHQIQELDGSVRDVELEQGDVEVTSVKAASVLDRPGGPVGYLMFTTFVRPGEDELRAAFRDFRARGVERLVIDLRYNSGGLLSTAALLGSLIDTAAAGEPLIVETYNQRHLELNRLRLMYETEEGIAASHVVFLTTGRTASASEQVINGLTPHTRVDVVGLTTLGKPVGSDSWDHCQYTISPITFHSLNAAGEGDYFSGIEPACDVPDDLLHRLGDPEEAQLASALRLLDGESACGSIDKALSSLGTRGAEAATPHLLPRGRFPELPGWY